jgi:FlaA1/EpsC-like NDP-sugar epimerase
MLKLNRKILNYLVIIILSLITFSWTFWIFHREFMPVLVATVIAVRMLASTLLFKDYALSWSKATPKTFLIKSAVYLAAFAVYMPIFYSEVHVYFLVTELFTYLFAINLLMYGYAFYVNRSRVEKTKEVVIYGAGKAGLKLEEEFRNSPYKIRYFVDDAKVLHGRSIDGIRIISKENLKKRLGENRIDLLVIAMPSAPKRRIQEVYEHLHDYFHKIQILPPLDDMLLDKPYAAQLQEVSVTDLLARHPQDLDREKISSFVQGKTLLITGAGGSIGSEIVRQCIKFGAKKLVLLDHSEYNLYQIEQEVGDKAEIHCVMQSVVNKEQLQKTFQTHKPQIVIHAAAYKHVPLVEENVEEAILNNVVGTMNCIDISIANGVEKFILISTDKAVRPTNVMGTTKRICELYAQNVEADNTEIVAVRFGNVLGSSGSVVPKFKEQIEKGGPITVTHPEITRYFMLIPEACQLVLQAGAIGRGGEIFILDMGEPVKIVDLAKKMIELSGRDDIEIEFTGLRPGEKLYEELLIDDTDCDTQYESITVARPTRYDIDRLRRDITSLLEAEDKLPALKKIVPEFNHRSNDGSFMSKNKNSIEKDEK